MPKILPLLTLLLALAGQSFAQQPTLAPPPRPSLEFATAGEQREYLAERAAHPERAFEYTDQRTGERVKAWRLGGERVTYTATAESLHDCVCNVTCPPYGGSATLVAVSQDRHGLVIGVAHIFEEGDRSRITCEFPTDRKKIHARLLGSNKQYDLAALDIANAPDIKLPAGIVKASKADEPFCCVGYPYNSRQQLRWNTGRFVGYDSGYQPSMLFTSNHVISGYSGGARFNRFGEYVGPISGMQGDGNGPMNKCWGGSGDALLKFVGKFVEVGK